jgi:hypothetical protein
MKQAIEMTEPTNWVLSEFRHHLGTGVPFLINASRESVRRCDTKGGRNVEE